MNRLRIACVACLLIIGCAKAETSEEYEVLEEYTIHEELSADWDAVAFKVPVFGGIEVVEVTAVREKGGTISKIVVSSDSLLVELQNEVLSKYFDAKLHTLRLTYSGAFDDVSTQKLYLSFNYGESKNIDGQVRAAAPTYDYYYDSVTFVISGGVVEKVREYEAANID